MLSLRRNSIGLILLLLTTSCGKEFCVGPFGTCQEPSTTADAGVDSTSLTVTASADEVSAGVQFSITASGGTTPYDFVIVSGGASVVSLGDSQATYTAPSVGEQSVVIRVTDAAGTFKNKSIYVR